MHKKRIWRTAVLFLCLFVLGFVTAVYYSREISHCMGVPILTEEEYSRITEYTQQDLSGILLADGFPAAVDRETNTVYLSQNITEETYYTDLKGVVSSEDENILLYFAPDENLADMPAAVKNGYPFKLIAKFADGSFARCDVVFTSLPVLNMDGDVAGVKKATEYDANGDRDIYSGTVSVWDGCYAGTGEYSAKSSAAQWHQRGNSTFRYDKKSWKLNFKDKEGNNADMDFLGLEADDDWVLNAVARDDTRLREKVVMDLWNNGMAQEEYNYKMSASQYVEVVTNGEYMGIYLLQRRLDAKYLELDENIQLAKGGKGHILYEPVDTTETEATLDMLVKLREGENVKYLDVHNWIDNSLFIDAFYMADNASRYNTYYIIKDITSQPQISIALWDTDFSFGIGYNLGFVHQPEKADEQRRNKDELYLLAEIYPDIYSSMSQRWQQLRQGVLSTENVLNTITANHTRLTDSGAFARDDVKWPDEYGGTDTYEAMCRYVSTRLEYLDSCYENGDVIRETGDTVPDR